MDFSAIFIKILFSIFSVAMIYIFAKIYYFYTFTVKSWQKTEGKIITSEFVYNQKKDSDNDTWEQSIKYQYCINGINFTNNLMSKNIKLSSTIKDVVKKMSTEYTKGQKITVTYNPKNPKESVIDDKFNYYTLVFCFVALLMVYCFIF